MPGAATLVRVLMMIGGVLGLGLALLAAWVSLDGTALMQVDSAELLITVVLFVHSAIAITLAVRMGRPGAGVYVGVLTFQALSLLVILATLILTPGLGMSLIYDLLWDDSVFRIFALLVLAPVPFSLTMILLMLPPGPRAYYLSGA
ncbi:MULTISPECIES: hypothetical protein [unclassified Nocardiopsis]|uniref:hypothetical protein n=1 Tax=Nocardiopsis TaxID=2013 RepID=UPI00387B9A07